ncbi:IclR family transcriptional regulator [Pedococcus sp. P5_B7]
MAAGSEDGARALAKTFQILDLFTEEEPIWSTGAIIEALDATRSTGYRYIKALHDAGLLASVHSGSYSLGPRIIEMDLKLRLTDPLLLASHGVLEGLVEQIGHSATLCTAYRDSVLCIGEFRDQRSPANRFIRGQRRSLFQGAISKVILAYLPHYRLKAIYPRDAAAIEKAGLGGTWKEFRSTLGDIKKRGYHVTVGEFNPGVIGVAAPVLNGQRVALGSVGVAWDERQRQDVHVERAIEAVKDAAATISSRLVRED